MNGSYRFSSPGLVLQSRPFRESDSIISLLTQKYGRISARARGARRSKRRFMGGIEAFDYGIFELSTTKRHPEYHCIEGFPERKVLLHLRNDFLKLSLSSYCLELTSAFLLEGEKESGTMLKPLIHSLEAIDNATEEDTSYYHVIIYNLRILSFCGYNPCEDSHISTNFRTWFIDLLSGKISSLDVKTLPTREGYLLLANYSQDILGFPLSTLGDIT